MKIRDGQGWRDRLDRLAALPPALVDGKPWRPKLSWRFRYPDRLKVTLKKGTQWLPLIVAA